MNLLARSTQKPKEFSDFEYNWTEYSNDFFPSIFLLTPLASFSRDSLYMC